MSRTRFMVLARRSGTARISDRKRIPRKFYSPPILDFRSYRLLSRFEFATSRAARSINARFHILLVFARMALSGLSLFIEKRATRITAEQRLLQLLARYSRGELGEDNVGAGEINL